MVGLATAAVLPMARRGLLKGSPVAGEAHDALLLGRYCSATARDGAQQLVPARVLGTRIVQP